MRACTEVQRGIIIGSFDPVDFGERDEGDLAGRLDGESVEIARVILAEFDLLLCAREGEIKTRVVKGLQEIVERSGLESAKCVLIIRSDEDDGRREVGAQEFNDVEAVALWHLHVEEEEVRARAADLSRRFWT